MKGNQREGEREEGRSEMDEGNNRVQMRGRRDNPRGVGRDLLTDLPVY